MAYTGRFMAPHDNMPHSLTGLNLALFVTGGLLGVVLLAARLALDFQSLTSERTTASYAVSLFQGVETAFLLGFVVSLVAMISGGFLWMSGGHPANRREASWTLTGAILVLTLLVSLVLMFLLERSGMRIGLLLGSFLASSLLLTSLIVSFVRAAFKK